MPDIPQVVWHAALLMQSALSVSALIYAYTQQRARTFHEHTLAGLAHELKSPLAAIEGALEVLNSPGSARGNDARQNEYFNMIERNSARLHHYVNNLLHVFKLQEGDPALHLDTVNVTALGEKCVEAYRPIASTKRIALRFSAAPIDIHIHADPVKIEQVISNLLSNAIKFTDAGDVVLSIRDIGELVEVAVTDTGRGMAPAEIPYVFERFFQGKSGRHTKGTGIGLTIARMWVEAHGGEIAAESAGPGRGSRFRFTIPKN